MSGVYLDELIQSWCLHTIWLPLLPRVSSHVCFLLGDSVMLACGDEGPKFFQGLTMLTTRKVGNYVTVDRFACVLVNFYYRCAQPVILRDVLVCALPWLAPNPQFYLQTETELGLLDTNAKAAVQTQSIGVSCSEVGPLTRLGSSALVSCTICSDNEPTSSSYHLRCPISLL